MGTQRRSQGTRATTTMLDQSPTVPATPRRPRRRMRPSTRLAAAVLEVMPEATVVTDMAGTIQLVNRQTEALFGYPRQELLGQPVAVLLPEYQRSVPQHGPQQQGRTDSAADSVAVAPSPPLGSAAPFLGRRRDGREFPVDVMFTRLERDVEQDGGPFLIASVHKTETREMSEVQHTATTAYQQLQRLLSVTDTALAHLELDDLLPALLDRVLEVLAVDRASLHLLDTTGHVLRTRAARGLGVAASAALPIPVGEGVAGRIAATWQPLIVADVSLFPVVNVSLLEGLRSAMGVPLLLRERLVGVLTVSASESHAFTHEDVGLLERVAERIIIAIERAQLFAAEQAARHEAERERARWHAAMESVPELVITCDVDLHMTYVNPAYARLRGSPADPLVPVEERPGRYGLFLPDGQRLFPAEQLPLSRAVREERPVHDAQMMLRTFQGEERLVEWEAAPMYSARGELLGAVAIGHDVTERRQMEREREQARTMAERQAAQMEATFEAMADGVAVFDAQGHLVRENSAQRRLLGLDAASPDYAMLSLPERMALFTARDAQGRLLGPDEGPLPRALHGEVVSGVETMDMRSRTLDGREVELNVSAAPLRGHDGQLTGAVAVFRDQTERNQLERATQELAAQLQATLDTMSDAVFLYDTAGHVLQLNAAAETLVDALFAEPPAAGTGTSWQERVQAYHPRRLDGSPLPLDERPLARVLRGEVLTAAQAQDVVMTDARGHDLVLNYRGGPARDEAGQLIGYVLMVRDVTERRRLQREREEARVLAERRAEELDRVFEAMADGVAVYDQDGQLVRANAALRHLLGFDAPSPDFARLSLPERFALFAARDAHGHPVAPQEGPLMRALGGEVLAGPEALDGRLRTVDGREVELRVSAAPIRTHTGQVVGAVCVYRDVTEPKRLERELAEQAEQLDRIVEGIGEGLIVYDTQGNVVRTNTAARRLLGLDAAPLDFSAWTAQARLALFTPAAGPQEQEGQQGDAGSQGPLLTPAEWLAALEQQGGGEALRVPEARDIRLRTLDGRELEVSASLAPLRNPDGQVVGGVLLVSDRTERNQLLREREEGRARELAAQELAQQLDQFFAMAAHDIRSPLTALSGSVQNASKRLQRLQAVQQGSGAAVQAQDADLSTLTTPLATALDLAQTSVQRLVRLVDKLFDVASARSGAVTLDLTTLDLAALVREQVAAQRLAVPDRRIELHLPTRPVLVLGDAVRLGQVVTNYLSNALKYSADDQPATVRLSVMDHVARLAVEDRGAGLSMEQQMHVWDMYHQVPNMPVHMGASAHLESQGVGLGLGLYIVKRLVELHPGGHVGVDSAVGQGATFWFTLPLAMSDGAL